MFFCLFLLWLCFLDAYWGLPPSLCSENFSIYLLGHYHFRTCPKSSAPFGSPLSCRSSHSHVILKFAKDRQGPVSEICGKFLTMERCSNVWPLNKKDLLLPKARERNERTEDQAIILSRVGLTLSECLSLMANHCLISKRIKAARASWNQGEGFYETFVLPP